MASAIIDSVATGNVTIVAAPTGTAGIRVFDFFMTAGGSDTVYFVAGSASTKLTGSMPISTTSGMLECMFTDGLFDVAPGNALVLNKAAAVQVGGAVRYQTYG